MHKILIPFDHPYSLVIVFRSKAVKEEINDSDLVYPVTQTQTDDITPSSQALFVPDRPKSLRVEIDFLDLKETWKYDGFGMTHFREQR